jgi:hypothetical protein
MGSPKPVFVARFEIPPEAPFFRRPEHEIQHRLACDGIIEEGAWSISQSFGTTLKA